MEDARGTEGALIGGADCHTARCGAPLPPPDCLIGWLKREGGCQVSLLQSPHVWDVFHTARKSWLLQKTPSVSHDCVVSLDRKDGRQQEVGGVVLKCKESRTTKRKERVACYWHHVSARLRSTRWEPVIWPAKAHILGEQTKQKWIMFKNVFYPFAMGFCFVSFIFRIS